MNARDHGHTWAFEPGVQLEEGARPSRSIDEVRIITLANDNAAMRGRLKLWMDKHRDSVLPAALSELQAIAALGVPA